MTICQNLIILYRSAKANGRDGEVQIIEDCFIMAKKMNRELVKLHNNGELPVIANNSWNEEDWIKEINEHK